MHASRFSSLYSAHNRDHSIKPENIMIGANGAKLIDFGFSLRLGGSEEPLYHNMLVGTVNYLAPELVKVLDGRADDSWSATIDWLKVDVWAVGITVACMALRRFPWVRACALTSKEYCAYVSAAVVCCAIHLSRAAPIQVKPVRGVRKRMI
jgi:serine/threonine protein kinase